MAAAQSAEQKAAAEKAGAEKQAAEAKAAEEAAAKAAAEAEGADESDENEPEGSHYVVTGVVAVIRTKDGSEWYLYRGARVDAGAFDEASLEHLVSIGLISEPK